MSLDAIQQAEFVGQITRHQTALRAYIISLMPGMDGVSDVLQETNLVLWEKRGKYQPGTNFQAWACAIARYEVKTHRRKMLSSSPSTGTKLPSNLTNACGSWTSASVAWRKRNGNWSSTGILRAPPWKPSRPFVVDLLAPYG